MPEVEVPWQGSADAAQGSCCGSITPGRHTVYCQTETTATRKALGPPASNVWWIGRPDPEGETP